MRRAIDAVLLCGAPSGGYGLVSRVSVGGILSMKARARVQSLSWHVGSGHHQNGQLVEGLKNKACNRCRPSAVVIQSGA
jgi:hypothetical protein